MNYSRLLTFVALVASCATSHAGFLYKDGCHSYHATQAGTAFNTVIGTVPWSEYGGVNGCWKTTKDAYDAVILAVNAHTPIPFASGVYTGGVDIGKTWTQKKTFRKVALTPQQAAPHSDGRTANCSEPMEDYPDAPDDSTVFAWCGIEETTVTEVSDGTVRTDVSYQEMTGEVSQVCNDGRLIPNGSGGVKCVAIVDIYEKFQDSPSCLVQRAYGNPIYPMQAAKKETVPTGFVVGGIELSLSYDSSVRHVRSNLWSNNLFKNLHVKVDPQGSGSASLWRQHSGRIYGALVNSAGYGARSGFDVCGGAAANRTTFSRAASGFQFSNASGTLIESYDSTGKWLGDYSSTGDVLTPSFSDATTSTAIAPAPGYVLRVTDNTGRYISFTYILPTGGKPASDGLIKTITNSEGQTITVGYDGNWHLTTVTWPDSKVRTFLYEDPINTWALTGMLDENGTRFATWAYSPEGDALSSQHAGGVDAVSIDYGSYTAIGAEKITEQLIGNYLCRYHKFSPPSTFTATMGNGVSSTVNVDVSTGIGLAVSSTQPAGSGCLAANHASTIDSKGNVLSHDDFNGNRTCFAYDSSDRQITRVEGLANTVSCSSVLPAGSNLPTGSSKITTAYLGAQKIATRVNKPGVISQYIYNGQPDPYNNNAVANCSTAPALPNGVALSLLCKSYDIPVAGVNFNDPSVIPQGVGDAYANSVILLSHADGVDGSKSLVDSSSLGRTGTIARNGKISTAKSRFGGSSQYVPNATDWGDKGYFAGDYSFTGNFTVEFSVNVMGSAVQIPAIYIASATDYVWFGLSGTRAVVGFKDGQFCSFPTNYWNANGWNDIAFVRNGSQIFAMTNGTLNGDSGFCTRSGSIGGTQYLVAGMNNANSSEYYLDEVRLTRGVARYPTGAQYTPSTTAFANPLPSTAAVTTFTYDAAGRVLTATDSLGKTTSYTYYADTTFTNGVGHTKGDLYQVTNAAGKSMTVNSYDPSGRILKMTDPNGMVTEMAYSPRGWVTSVSVTPAGGNARVTTYTYDNVGQATGVTNPDGTTMSMTYDAAHRLVGATDAKGNSVAYTLDNVGNRIAEELKDPSGTLQRTLSRTFDALNRVQQVKLQ